VGRAVGIEIAVGGIQQGTDEVSLLYEGQQLLGLPRRQDRGLEAEIACPAVSQLEPLHALGGVGEQQPSRAMQAAGLAGDPLELVVQADGIALEFGDVRVAVQRVKPACRVPGGARRELITLDQYDVLPPRLRQMIENAAPDDAAADDDHLCVRSHAISCRFPAAS